MKSIIISFMLFLLFGCSSSNLQLDTDNRISALEAQMNAMKAEMEQIKTTNLELRNKFQFTEALLLKYETSFTKTIELPSQTVNEKKEVETGSSTQCQAITQAGTQCKRTAQAGSLYCWQHQNYGDNKETKVGNSESGKTIYTGPRGGQYYINSKGNKTYIKKKK